MKKICLFLLILCLLPISITKVDATVEIGGAQYQEFETPLVTKLPYGVVHTLSHPETATSLSGYDVDGLGGISGTVVPGQFYKQQVNVLEVPSNKTVKIASWANLNGHKWTLTTVKNSIMEYEEKNPDWKVIAAINADYFDLRGLGNLPFQTSGAFVNQGEFYKTTTGGLVGFTNDGTANSLIGNMSHPKTKMKLAVYNEVGEIVNEFEIQKLNQTPSANETTVYFGTYDTSHRFQCVNVDLGTAKGYFVKDADLALPNNANDFYGKGTISTLEPNTLDIGEFAVVTNNPSIQDALAVGVKIRCQFEYGGDYANVDTVSGCQTTIMKGGIIPSASYNDTNLTNRAPRTVVGKKADGTIVFMVIDGRQGNKNMFGADLTELAVIMKSYDCVEAYNLDGGGSSTMVIKQDGEFKVMNFPSDGNERLDANCLLIAVKEPRIDITINQTEDSISIDANILNNNNHDIQELIVKLNNKMVIMDEDGVTFTKLEKNTDYPWKLYFKDSLGQSFELLLNGTVKTLMTPPTLLGLEVRETNTEFLVKVLYDDPDETSLISVAKLNFNGIDKVLENGNISLLKAEVGDTIEQIKLIYSYDINRGPVIQTLNDISFSFVSSVEVMNITAFIISSDTIISNIYK